MTTPSNYFAHKVVRASAGSGKTFQLSERYLKLLLSGATVDSILATTFTRKAAGEIQDRILSRLGQGALSDEGAAKLSSELFNGDESALTRERLQDLTIDVVRSLHRLRVCTLDSFFMQISGGFAFEIGLPPNWRIVEETEYKSLLHNAILASLGQSKTENAVQLAGMLFKGDLKRSIKSQISALVADALDVYYESDFEDWTRLDALATKTPLELKELFERSFNVLQCAEVPTTKAGTPRKNYANAKTRTIAEIQAKKWGDFLKETLVQNALNGANFDRVPIPDSFQTSIEGLAEYVKQQAYADAARQTRATWIALDAVSNYFQRFKLEKGAYRFDDLSRRLVELEFANKLRQIVYRLDTQTSHILLDEFQDASFTQWAIIKPFAESIVKRSPTPDEKPTTSFYCVGDVKQAIYGWRGGVAGIFDAIQRDLPNVVDDSLEYNWRSCPTIINVVNLLFGKLRENPALQTKDDGANDGANALRDAVFTWTSRFNEHRVAAKNLSKLGYWALEVAPRVDEATGKAPSPALPPINVFNGETENVDDEESATWEQVDDEDFEQGESETSDEEENDEDNSYEGSYGKLTAQATVNYAVERIVQLRRRYPGASIGVLTRTNKRIAQIIAKLKKKGIEASEEGGVPLTDSPAVVAVLSVLKLASHPGDSVAEFHVANVAPLARRFNMKPRGSKNESFGRYASSYIRRVVETRGLGRFVAELRDLLKPICESSRDVERLDKLTEFAFSYQLSALKVDLDEFIQATREKKIESPSSSSLRVMSLHKSKGLQFDVVVLPELDARVDRVRSGFYVGRETPTSPINCVLKSLPKAERAGLPAEFKKVFSDALQAQLEEALCLLYVGLTRPVRMLVAIVQPNRKDSHRFPTFGNILRGAPGVCAPLPDTSPYYRRAQILFESGDPDWAQKDSTAQKALCKSRVETKNDESAFQRPLFSTPPISARDVADATKFSTTPDRRLLLRRKTPTGEREKRIWKRDVNFRQGAALHACFESIEWLDVDGVPSDERLESVLYPILSERSEVRRALERFHEAIKSPFVRMLLSRATYERPTTENAPQFGALLSAATCRGARSPVWRVFRERPFSMLKDKDLLVRGTIDRLVVLYDGDRAVGADVLDYKTDRFTNWEEFSVNPTKFEEAPNGSPIPRETLEEYREQLAFYGEVVGKQFALSQDQISLRLAFVDAGEGYALDARQA